MIVYAASPTKTLAIVLVTVGIVALLAAIFTVTKTIANVFVGEAA